MLPKLWRTKDNQIAGISENKPIPENKPTRTENKPRWTIIKKSTTYRWPFVLLCFTFCLVTISGTFYMHRALDHFRQEINSFQEEKVELILKLKVLETENLVLRSEVSGLRGDLTFLEGKVKAPVAMRRSDCRWTSLMKAEEENVVKGMAPRDSVLVGFDSRYNNITQTRYWKLYHCALTS